MTVRVPKGKATPEFYDAVAVFQNDLENVIQDMIDRLVKIGWSEAEARSAIRQLVEQIRFES